MGFLINLFSRYRTIHKRMDDHTTLKTTLFGAGISLLFTVLVAVPLIVAVATLFMFVYWQLFAAILIILIVVGAVFCYEFSYFYVIKKFHPESEAIQTNLVVLVESTLIGILIIIIGIIVVSAVFGRI